jgi:hypothetical protein
LKSAPEFPQFTWFVTTDNGELLTMSTPSSHEPASLVGLRFLMEYGLTISKTGCTFSNFPTLF